MKPQLENQIEEMFSIIESQGKIEPAQAINLLAEIQVYSSCYDKLKAREYFERLGRLR